MPTAAFNKFNSFAKACAEHVHNLATDQLKIMLTNTAPVATNAIKTDITEIAAGHGYPAGGIVSPQVSSTQTGGTYKLVITDEVLTAAGGPIGPFRYTVLYNNTAANKELIGWWDYGVVVTLADTEDFTFDTDGVNGVLQIV